ncbi:MAG: glycoside hydrolase family 3 N-terminal domain-containing protein, partial [Patulibacter sp.]
MLKRAATVGAALTLVLAGCGSSSSTPTDRAPSATVSTATAPTATGTNPGAEAPAPAEPPIALHDAIGQMIVTRYLGPTPTPTVLDALREGRVGGIMLYADNVPSQTVLRRAARQLVRAADEGDRPHPLILIDQEGGRVKRLKSIPPDFSGAEMGAARSPYARARREGRKTGRALREMGVTVNLAPLADVPDRARTFLENRPFSRSPAVVARAACGFAEGLQEQGVSATLKHFPGLGRAPGHTDEESITVDASAAELSRDLA